MGNAEWQETAGRIFEVCSFLNICRVGNLSLEGFMSHFLCDFRRRRLKRILVTRLAKMFLVEPKQSLQRPNQELELTRFQVWVFDQAVDGFRNLFEILGRKDRQMEKLKPIFKMRCVHAHVKYLCMVDFHAMWVYSKVPCARKGAATMPV